MYHISNFVHLKVQRLVLDLIQDSLKFKVEPNITAGVTVFKIVVDSQVQSMTYNLIRSVINIHCFPQRFCMKTSHGSAKVKSIFFP